MQNSQGPDVYWKGNETDLEDDKTKKKPPFTHGQRRDIVRTEKIAHTFVCIIIFRGL
ncbi:MAG: hypothetical protein QXU32_03365 [Nitrososphaerales archaeon]